MNENNALRWIAVITAEKIDEARYTLELGETATFSKVKKRYRELAKKWHPDVCSERNPAECQKRFRKITNAKTLLMRLMRLYRYSLRRNEIERDQEPSDIKFYRVYGGQYTGCEGTESNPVEILSRQNRNLVTAENVLRASEILGLSDFASRAQIESAFASRINNPDSSRHSPEADRHARWAYKLLMSYIEDYNYSFRPDDIRNYQEDAIERHRRQFGNEPMWAGGTYDTSDSK